MSDTKRLSERLDWYHRVSGAPADKDLADAARALETELEHVKAERDSWHEQHDKWTALALRYESKSDSYKERIEDLERSIEEIDFMAEFKACAEERDNLHTELERVKALALQWSDRIASQAHELLAVKAERDTAAQGFREITKVIRARAQYDVLCELRDELDENGLSCDDEFQRGYRILNAMIERVKP